MSRLLTLFALLFAAPLSGQPIDACAIEATARGRASCLELEADRRLLDIETRLANVAASLQGARAAAIVGFEGGLMSNQDAWRRKAERTCRRAANRVDRQSCRIEQIAAREATLERTLTEAFAPVGGLPGQTGFGTDGVEIFVPLDPTGEPRPFIRFDTLLTPPN